MKHDNIAIALLQDHCEGMEKDWAEISRIVKRSELDKLVIWLDYHKFDKAVVVNKTYYEYAKLRDRGKYTFVPNPDVFGVLSSENTTFGEKDLPIDFVQESYEELNDLNLLNKIKRKFG